MSKREPRLVPPGEITISPSSLKLWGQCERRWAAAYLLDIRDPSTEAQEFGSEGHRQLEVWAATGTLPDQATPEGRAAIEAIEHIPAGDREIESELRLPIAPGVSFHGYSDLIVRTADGPVVIDYKFSSDPARYGLQPDELRIDPQALGYPIALAARDNVTTAIEALWIYLRKSPPKAYPRRAWVDPSAGAERFRELFAPTIVRLAHIRRSATEGACVDSVNQIGAVNLEQCFAYRKRCPFADSCNYRSETMDPDQMLDIAEKLYAAHVPIETALAAAQFVPGSPEYVEAKAILEGGAPPEAAPAPAAPVAAPAPVPLAPAAPAPVPLAPASNVFGFSRPTVAAPAPAAPVVSAAPAPVAPAAPETVPEAPIRRRPGRQPKADAAPAPQAAPAPAPSAPAPVPVPEAPAIPAGQRPFMPVPEAPAPLAIDPGLVDSLFAALCRVKVRISIEVEPR